MGKAIGVCRRADIFIVVGTSLQVYPAAGLLDKVPHHAVKYFVDPQASKLSRRSDIICFDENATIALPTIVKKLLT